MTRFDLIKHFTVDELADYIIYRARAIEAARNGIREVGGDPDRWDIWKSVIKAKLLEEIEYED